MSRKKKVEGICHICGAFGPLSFEHVPPRKAFNSSTGYMLRGYDAIKMGVVDYLPGHTGQHYQGGIGGNTLCGRCNNNTGSWYGKAYIDWATQGLEVLLRTGLAPTLYYAFRIYPLRVIKQIICCFMSINDVGFRNKNDELVRFVLDKERFGLNPKYHIFVFYCTSRFMRSSGVTARKSLGYDHTSCVFSEFVYPPWGYTLVLDSNPPDKNLIDITSFAKFSYSYSREIHLRLPVMPISTALPGDYRTKKEVDELVEQSRQEEKDREMSRKGKV